MKLTVQAYRNIMPRAVREMRFEPCDIDEGEIFCLRAEWDEDQLNADLYAHAFSSLADAQEALGVIDALAKRAWRQLFRNHPGAHPDDIESHEELGVIYKDLIAHDKSSWSDQEYYPSDEQRKAFVGLLEDK